ncbi:MAG: Fe-S cluster assembly protein SufB, partial [Candidatus Gracilibacteria bacterium]|nr:Fe-S cluster assembly protein SufB [Candidatus Gracilibacteria bacterium]
DARDFNLNTPQNITYSKVFGGLSEESVRKVSTDNNEPEWMLDIRLRAFRLFQKMPYPKWGPDLSALDLESISYYAEAGDTSNAKSWDQVPDEIRKTFDELGIPEAERESLAGVGAQFDSKTVYHSTKKEYEDLGVVFTDMNTALTKYPEMVRKYFSRVISMADHTFMALHTAFWNGGTFLYVPAGVKLDEPLQSYFRMNVRNGGQFEHTIIVIEDGADAHYIEGCSAPKYDSATLHAGCVEVLVGKNANFRYSSVENWSHNTYNLNTKRAIIEESGHIDWVGGNLGAGITMLYPCSVLQGDHASANHIGIAFANTGQIIDAGAKVIHIGKNTTSRVISKSLSKGGGISTYRGLLDIKENASHSVASIECDGLILDSISVSDAIPVIKIGNSTSTVSHEASAGKINEDFLFYLESRGIDRHRAEQMLVNGFISPVINNLPLEYASEMNILISKQIG